MIAVSSKSQSFDALARYLERGRSGHEHDRVDWSTSRNLPTAEPALGAKIMRATAAQNDRVQRPVYHLVLSFDPRDAIDRDTMERVADGVLRRLSLEQHQTILVAHRDRAHDHIHVMINRVHPADGRAWEMAYDYHAIQQILRETERTLGLHALPERRRQKSAEPGHAAAALDTPDGVRASTPAADVAPPERGARQPTPPRPAETPAIEQMPAHRSPATRGQDAVARGDRGQAVDGDLRGATAAGQGRGAVQEQYQTLVALEAARARLAQMETVAAWARDTERVFDRALGTAYRDPEHAKQAFVRAVDDDGITVVVRTMREHPERFGDLLQHQERRFAGLVRRGDTRAARAAAPSIAARGHDWIEATRVFRAVASEARVRRFEEAFVHRLSALYRGVSLA